MGVPFLVGGEDVTEYAKNNQLSIEEAARMLRYRFLFEQAEQSEAQAVAVAHTADDQVETVLMHFLRGAGLSGLKGMQPRAINQEWSATIPLARPLLAVWRNEILAYCNEHGLQPIHDESNTDLKFFRNRLRYELLPALEAYNPQIREVIWRTAQVLAGDQEIVADRLDQLWETCLYEQADSYCGFRLNEFRRFNIGEQRGLIRRAIERVRPNVRNIDFAHIEDAIAFVHSPPRSRCRDLVAGLRMLLEDKVFWVAGWEADLPALGWPQIEQAPCNIDLPGEIRIGQTWQLKAWIGEDRKAGYAAALSNDNRYAAWISGDQVESSLTVRKRQRGDRFQPLGMGGHTMKLADYFINKKLPKRAREKWPLICAGDTIVWIPGYQVNHHYRLTDETKKIIALTLEGVMAE
jgi:tRNA(Ile)-lysidine synthase